MIAVNEIHSAYIIASMDNERYAAKMVLMLLLRSISNQQSSSLGFVLDKGRATAPELAEAHGYKLNQAGTLLKRLHDLSLLEREPVVDEAGLHYVYRVADDVMRAMQKPIQETDNEQN